jgi:hypothetical protein
MTDVAEPSILRRNAIDLAQTKRGHDSLCCQWDINTGTVRLCKIVRIAPPSTVSRRRV